MKPSILCPQDCVMEGLPGCTPGCLHSRDKIFKNPEDVSVFFVRGQRKDAQVIGRADDTLYVKVEGEGIRGMSVNSQLIKSRKK
jgi:hypothetical protein